MPDYRPRRVILKLMTARMVADELGIPIATASSLIDWIAWKYGAVHIKGLRRNFIRRCDLELELERAGMIEVSDHASALVLPKLMTIAMLKRENGLTTRLRRGTTSSSSPSTRSGPPALGSTKWFDACGHC